MVSWIGSGIGSQEQRCTNKGFFSLLAIPKIIKKKMFWIEPKMIFFKIFSNSKNSFYFRQAFFNISTGFFCFLNKIIGNFSMKSCFKLKHGHVSFVRLFFSDKLFGETNMNLQNVLASPNPHFSPKKRLAENSQLYPGDLGSSLSSAEM